MNGVIIITIFKSGAFDNQKQWTPINIYQPQHHQQGIFSERCSEVQSERVFETQSILSIGASYKMLPTAHNSDDRAQTQNNNIWNILEHLDKIKWF